MQQNSIRLLAIIFPSLSFWTHSQKFPLSVCNNLCDESPPERDRRDVVTVTYPRGHNTVGHACVFFSDVTAGLASWTDRAAPACPYRRERLHGCAQLFVGQRVFPSASCKSAATYPDTGGGWDARDCPLSAKTGDSAQTPANSASISSRRALRLLYASNASRYSFSARALAAANASSNSRL